MFFNDLRTKLILFSKRSFFFSLFSLVSVIYSFIDLQSYFLRNSFFYTAFLFFIFVFLYFFYEKFLLNVKSFSLASMSIGIFAGILNVLGRNFELYDSMIFFYNERLFALLFSVIAAIGYGLFYAAVFEWGYTVLKCSNTIEQKHTGTVTKRFDRICYIIFDKNPFFHPFIFIVVFWIPYFIVFFPGILHWDAMDSLQQYYGFRVWTNHHPLVGALLMGYTMDIGKALGNDNYGCTIYIVLQLLLFSLTLAYGFIFFNKWKTNYYIRWAVLFVFAFCPIFPMFCINEIKDTAYYIAVLWLLYLFLTAYEECNISIFFVTVIAAMFVCCLRKEGILVCLFCLFLLLMFRHYIYDKWQLVAASLAVGIILAGFITNILTDYYHVKPGSFREALSLPIQQTARYIRDHGKDITPAEWIVLNDIFHNNAKLIGNAYEPNRSDAVKWKMRETEVLSKKQKIQYFRVWLNHFSRHPKSYFAAAFNQMYGYFYIGKSEFYGLGFSLENFKKGHVMYHEKITVTDNQDTERFRKAMINYFTLWKDTPFFGHLFHPATYTWLLVFALTIVVRFRQYKYLYLFCIPLVSLFVCCLSPLNASIRYSFPLVLSSLFLFAFSIKIAKE